MQPIVRTYAAPGSDSTESDQGVFSSGAGFAPGTKTTKASPWDWGSLNPTVDNTGNHFIQGYSLTGSQSAQSLRVRVRGHSPWGGFFAGRAFKANIKVGGNADTNGGAGSMIAGGRGQASSFVRVQKISKTRGMKLPILPDATSRGTALAMPAGGSTDGMAAAPLAPKLPGVTSIFGFIRKEGGQ